MELTRLPTKGSDITRMSWITSSIFCRIMPYWDQRFTFALANGIFVRGRLADATKICRVSRRQHGSCRCCTPTPSDSPEVPLTACAVITDHWAVSHRPLVAALIVTKPICQSGGGAKLICQLAPEFGVFAARANAAYINAGTASFSECPYRRSCPRARSDSKLL